MGKPKLIFWVKNPQTIPEGSRKQIFQRSFSTKGDPGRGVGTYSMKLFGEKVLGGQVYFTSMDGEGTCFYLVLEGSKVKFQENPQQNLQTRNA